MVSDQRGTGGPDYITGQVRRYLADCKAFKLTPSVEDALKVVFWSGDAQKAAIRTAYAAAVAPVPAREVPDGE